MLFRSNSRKCLLSLVLHFISSCPGFSAACFSCICLSLCTHPIFPSMFYSYITGGSGSQDTRFRMNYVRRNKRRNHPHHSSEGEQFTEAESEAHPDTDYVPEPEIQEEAPEVEVEEEEAQRNATARPKPRAKKAAGASHNKTLNDLSDKDFRDPRRINQYELDRSPQYDESSFFYTEFQERTLKEVIMRKDRMFVEHKQIGRASCRERVSSPV